MENNKNYFISKPNINNNKIGTKICKFCNQLFVPNANNQVICGACELTVTCNDCKEKKIFKLNKTNHRMYYKCKTGNDIILKYKNYLCIKCKNKILVKAKCIECKNIFYKKFSVRNKYCPICYDKLFIITYTCNQCGKKYKTKIDNRYKNHFCCAHCLGVYNGNLQTTLPYFKNMHKIIFCEECKKDTPHFNSSCTICHNKKINHEEFCIECKKITSHAGNLCLTCNGKKLNIAIECKIHGHQSHSFNGMCILCHNDKLNNKSEENFNIPIECKIHGHQNHSLLINKKHVCIECKKDKYDISYFIDKVKDELNVIGKIILTMRTKDNRWDNRIIFEKELTNNINWFVFAKITTNNLIAVVGKSGSRNVLNSKSDVSFNNRTLTSKLLIENNLEYNKYIIIIWNNKEWSEQDALNWETKIGDCLLKNFGIINSNSHKNNVINGGIK